LRFFLNYEICGKVEKLKLKILILAFFKPKKINPFLSQDNDNDAQKKNSPKEIS
tara:strand:- start:164 stop:325 length:162 start_codon:yes stop_codon:yes gene_type:complete